VARGSSAGASTTGGGGGGVEGLFSLLGDEAQAVMVIAAPSNAEYRNVMASPYFPQPVIYSVPAEQAGFARIKVFYTTKLLCSISN